MASPKLIAIVGGGISGLAAAFELSSRSIPFVLFEGSNRLGGVIRTDFVDGYTLDGGPDSMLVQKPAAIELCQQLGLGERLISTLPPRTAYVVKKRCLYPLPSGSVLGIPTGIQQIVRNRLLSVFGKTRMAMELAIPANTSGKDESIGSFFRRRFGAESVNYLADPLLAGIHAGDVNDLSVRSLFPRLVSLELQFGSVIRGLRAGRLSSTKHNTGPFRSLPNGIGELSRALTETLPSENLKTNYRVTRISRKEHFIVATATGTTFDASQVIVATPAYITAELVRNIDSELCDVCKTIPYTSTATVLLSYPRTSVKHDLRGTGFVVPKSERDVTLMAGSWVSSKWPGRAPDDQVLLRGFVGGVRNPDILERTDTELAQVVHSDFKRLLNISTTPEFIKIYRWPRQNPQHEVGHLEKLALIQKRVQNIPGLHLTGAAFRGVGLPDCIDDARSTAQIAAEQLQD